MFIRTAGHSIFTRPAGIIGLYHFPDGMPEPRNMFALDGVRNAFRKSQPH